MASIPSRISSLQTVVEAILPQVDVLNVYLNGFSEVPDFLHHPKVFTAQSQDSGDRGDAGKFFWVDQVSGYYITIDDDIVYPPDYVQRLLQGIDRRKGKAVVGFHGEIYGDRIVSWTRDRRATCHFIHHLANDTPVSILGTGTSGFHTSTLELKPSFFQTRNMADVWFTVACHQQGIPRVALAHPANWMRIIPIPERETIWGQTVEFEAHNPTMMSKEVELIQQCLPWQHMADVV